MKQGGEIGNSGNTDRQLYKSLLAQTSRQFGLEICAYCLITNHIHLIAVPRDEKARGLAPDSERRNIQEHVQLTTEAGIHQFWGCLSLPWRTLKVG
ncbi:MAG: hypothetical protein ACR2IE_06770 [Candidatus Sumerlaeaceae bacterium]